jgi:hypothetical protein
VSLRVFTSGCFIILSITPGSVQISASPLLLGSGANITSATSQTEIVFILEEEFPTSHTEIFFTTTFLTSLTSFVLQIIRIGDSFVHSIRNHHDVFSLENFIASYTSSILIQYATSFSGFTST